MAIRSVVTGALPLLSAPSAACTGRAVPRPCRAPGCPAPRRTVERRGLPLPVAPRAPALGPAVGQQVAEVLVVPLGVQRAGGAGGGATGINHQARWQYDGGTPYGGDLWSPEVLGRALEYLVAQPCAPVPVPPLVQSSTRLPSTQPNTVRLPGPAQGDAPAATMQLCRSPHTSRTRNPRPFDATRCAPIRPDPHPRRGFHALRLARPSLPLSLHTS